MSEIIPRSFYSRRVIEVAPDLVGMWLVRQINGARQQVQIVETEAYEQSEPACHAHRGQTSRNIVMFGCAGYAYVYFVYGMHYCFNIVTDKENTASAVLIRAVAFRDHARLGAGPAKACKALSIDKTLNGIDVTNPQGGLWLEVGEFPPLTQTTRIGITKGVDLPWRWYWQGHQSVSKTSRDLDKK
ncbi:MAG: DNA-3-methyladenine glycosylase [Merismopedia sp. SIO2A8]|nr:DNA-3-methyladenine glycosylase [Symploca sp. SIO2B6]NET47237.1 DNA-3-methyladenine glycosylase [Merismopedia sp. SIO2A8]